jgi:predicted DNA-binding protein (MmcQ/YjbR family)
MAGERQAMLRRREMCLSLAGAREGDHFGETVFRVGGRIFASRGVNNGRCQLVFRRKPAHAKKVLAADGRFTRYPLQPNCVQLGAKDVRDWKEVRALVLESYGLNAPRRRPRSVK